MAFTQVKNVRITSLTENAVVQLRFGKAAVKSPKDSIVMAKLLRQYTEGAEDEKTLVVFQVTADDGQVSETTITRFPGAPWRSGQQYVSLVAVDESTYTIQRAASPIQTDAIADAIALIEKERDDVYGPDQLIALLAEIQGGKRVNTEIKALANRLAVKLVDELNNLPAKEPAAV